MTVLLEWYPSILAGMEMLAGFHYFTRFIGKRVKVIHYMLYLFAVGALVVFSGKALGEMLLLGASLVALLMFALCGGAVYRHFLHAEEDGRSERMLLPLVPVMLLVLVSRYIRMYLYGDTSHMQPDGSLL